MKDISFYNNMKCIINNECRGKEEYEIEIQKEEITSENIKQDNALPLNFQLFDIDRVFAN
jgi:hypothetical protein